MGREAGAVSAVDVVAIVVGAFFLIGVVVGVIAVVAMSVLRPDRKRRNPPAGSYELPPPAGYGVNDELGKGRPRWPDAG